MALVETLRTKLGGAMSYKGEGASTIQKTQNFEFVTITTEPSTQIVQSISRQVRTHAMRDYLRKRKEAINDRRSYEATSSVALPKPAEYKGKFKLNSRLHKVTTNASRVRRPKGARGVEAKDKNADDEETTIILADETTHEHREKRRSLGSFVVSGSLDPFDSLAIELNTSSQQILYYYNTAYSMNSVAVNAENNFFSYVRIDPGLFHSIMYLTALHYDLKQNMTDSAVTLHHGSKTFGIINQRLQNPNGIFSDMTIGAVAILVSKENLSGRYALSKLHMQGLKSMVAKRGGVEKLAGIFQRIVTWADFCFASIWNSQPVFPRLSDKILPLGITSTDLSYINLSLLFEHGSRMESIFTDLRTLSYDLDPNHIAMANRLEASTRIYNVEYNILMLNKATIFELGTIIEDYSFKIMPLKTATQLYLWLVIRELPLHSELVSLMVWRLKTLLSGQDQIGWCESSEDKTCLLWVLFIGALAASGRGERYWFVTEVGKVCKSLGIWSLGALRATLMRVLWQEAFCEEHCVRLWWDVRMLEEEDGGLKNVCDI